MAPSEQGQSATSGIAAIRSMPPLRLEQLLGTWRTGDHDYRDLASAFRTLTLDGRLPPGTRIPSERALADLLGVSRNTVTATLNLLRLEGLLASRRGSGSWTTLPRTADARPDGAPTSSTQIDLTLAALPAPARLSALVSAASARLPGYLAGNGYHPYGVRDLREAIAAHLTGRGVPTRSDQILVTQGCLHGLDLALRTFAGPGDSVVVESPTYPAALDAIAALGARALPVSIDDSGWDIAFLETTLAATAPRLAYVMPDHQNPTGVRVPEEQRRALLAAARRSGTIIVVDEVFADVAFDDEPSPPRLAALDRHGITVTLGSLSKSCWGGLRVGWIRAAPALIDRLARTRSIGDGNSSVLDALIGIEVLRDLDSLLVERRTLVTGRRDRFLELLGRDIPEWRLATVPRGGLCLWMALPGPTSTQIAARARSLGVLLAPGPRFDAAGQLDHRLRLPLVAVDLLDDAVGRLADAAHPRRMPGRQAPSPEWVV